MRSETHLSVHLNLNKSYGFAYCKVGSFVGFLHVHVCGNYVEGVEASSFERRFQIKYASTCILGTRLI